ncbi:MAG: SDR family oxidoreductase [Candidatus Thorarchaeota archaeon]|nr:SDR family oxidoreductase [Candidatus Thorarchaeota archaeon]
MKSKLDPHVKVGSYLLRILFATIHNSGEMVLKDKVCIVTGSNSGIGRETALALAEKGATVVAVVRNKGSGEEACSEIIEVSGNSSVDLMICDLSSMESIRSFVAEFKSKYDRLDVLLNNAGAVISKRQVTNDGFERTIAVNYLAPFLLTHELLSVLKEGTQSRVINLSSGLHKRANLNLDDLQSESSYKSMNVYGSAKLMVVMHTYELARRLKDTGVSVNVVLPGFVATNLGRSSGSRASRVMFGMMKPFQLSPKEGAETSVYVASSPDVEGVTGKCFEKKAETESSEISYDVELQKQLWDATINLLGL